MGVFRESNLLPQLQQTNRGGLEMYVLIKYEMKSDGIDLNHQKKDENFFYYLHSA